MSEPTSRGRVVIAGGSGFVGTAVSEHLSKAGYEVVTLTREKEPSDPKHVQWDGRTVGPWARMLEGAKAVINLAGAPVTLRWTEANKKLIKSSRVDSTLAIGEAIRQCKLPPNVWINASGVGVYGSAGDAELNESSPVGEGFFAETCLAWERAQTESATPGVRKVRVRMGIVLGREGGAFAELAKYTSWYLGGAQGNGRHWMSWIHLSDVADIYRWAIESEVEGPVNAVATEPVRNADFMATLRKAMGSPWSPPAPAFAIRLVGYLRNMQTDVVLESTRVRSSVLESKGFKYQYGDLESALKNLVGDE